MKDRAKKLPQLFQDETKPSGKEKTPSQLKIPAYLMSFPFTLSTDVKNNVFMQKNSEPLDKDRAYGQWMKLYNHIACTAFVQNMPVKGHYQDIVYVANIGMYLPHTPDQTFILSKFNSPPRRGEERFAKELLTENDYKIVQSPFFFEGEAELKWLHDDVYIGGYGLRTDIKALEWFEKQFNMIVIKVKMTSKEQYHLDCSVFPLTSEKTLVFVKNYSKEEIKLIEKHTEIIPVPEDIYESDPTNCVRCNTEVLMNFTGHEMKKSDKEYHSEWGKLAFMEKVTDDNNLELVTFNMSEFAKSGASLSCCVCNLNFFSYLIPLV